MLVIIDLKTKYTSKFVEIESEDGVSNRIWTLCFNENSQQIPIVLLHGMGAGVGMWILNLDALSEKRPLYAIDLLGFGRSSRPNFSKDALEAESQLVTSIEQWREQMKLEKFILLGHSLGGYLAMSYSIKYPERVRHLILADAWGFAEKSTANNPFEKFRVPMWARALFIVSQPLNPLWAVRLAGPWGQWLIEKFRPNLINKFEPILKDDTKLMAQYLHQCNSQKPSGECAFNAMKDYNPWAKNPMVRRFDKLDPKIPITFLNGGQSWLDTSSSEVIKEKRSESYVHIETIPDAGHQIFTDQSKAFNESVIKVCALCDENTDINISNDVQKTQE
ncbi:hypothetical protein QAD02_006189 [Eretmocerus hayati]|uniref:Uncharacterized protein n=1 Tax=Eretmocerus hayati TaxID=131215 RepID=A0ACC2N2I7_9HYME|nr:hypothetical protein QAD02_006189 [Eretmocerus hayati]